MSGTLTNTGLQEIDHPAHRRWIATRPALDTIPTWALAAAYLTVAAFITRITAQIAITGPGNPLTPGTPLQAWPAMVELLVLPGG